MQKIQRTTSFCSNSNDVPHPASAWLTPQAHSGGILGRSEGTAFEQTPPSYNPRVPAETRKAPQTEIPSSPDTLLHPNRIPTARSDLSSCSGPLPLYSANGVTIDAGRMYIRMRLPIEQQA